jgi:hypothetical protein
MAFKRMTNQYTPWALLVIGIVLLGLGLAFVLFRDGAGPTIAVTSGISPDTTVTTTPGQTALGSDVIDSFFLGSGAVLILTAAFYPRISKIGLPGGGSIELNPVVQAKMAAAVGSKLNNPEQIAAAYHAATATLANQFWGAPAAPSDEAIENAASAAAAMFTDDR